MNHRLAECDTCDEKLRKVDPNRRRAAQARYLAAFAERPTVASAARLAGIHRATVYRWLADPAFVTAVESARNAFYRRLKATLEAEFAEREHWRRQRERERRPMRCAVLARARAAKFSRR